jgi:hypothetical protein
MIILLTDSTYNIIISYFDVIETQNMEGTGITMSQDSYIDGKKSLMYTLKMSDVPEDLREDLVSYYSDFIYTSEGGFKRRPMIAIESADIDQRIKISQDGASVFPVGKDINLRVKYIDPDGVGFIHSFDKIKIKDRNEFITTPTFFKVEEDMYTYEFSVKSNFPGVSLLRAKDVNYLCGFDTFLMRFKQP